MNLDVVLKVAKYEPFKASQLIDNLTLDGQIVNFEDAQLGQTEGNQFYNYKDVKASCGLVKAGIHEFTINLKGGPNIDCFDFTFSK